MKNKDTTYFGTSCSIIGIIFIVIYLLFTSCSAQKIGCLEKQTNYRKAKKGMVKCPKIKSQKGNPDLYLFGWRLKVR